VRRSVAVIIILALVASATLLGWWRPFRPGLRTQGTNVVLIIGCSVRKDQLSPYGGHADVTPSLRSATRRGALFVDAVTAAVHTTPSTAAILTGHHPVGPEPLLPDLPTLAERFRAAGYTTHGGTAHVDAGAAFGFDRGFDPYVDASGGDGRGAPGSPVIDEVLDQVRARRAGPPAFIQVLLADAHAPRNPSPLLARLFVDEVDLAPTIGPYRAAVHRFDQAVARLAVGLEGLGYDTTNTVFVVVSDHGEGLDHPKGHGHGYGASTLASATAMPWIAWGSGIAWGQVVEGLASQVDVAPTILGLVGVNGYAGPGKDWSAQLRGESKRTTRDHAYAVAWSPEGARAAVFTATRSCHVPVGDEPFRDNPGVTCFDRLADPLEAFPLPTPDTMLLEQLEGWMAVQGAETTVP